MRYFLTTAIDYVNSRPHLGTAYEKITADVIARYHRLKGDDTWFLMGNDEHSQNVFRRAQEQGKDPLAYCDEMEQTFRDTWRGLDVSFDDFIRTTDRRRHFPAVRAMAQACLDNGDIYEGFYEGRYCVGCEEFKPEKDLVDGLLSDSQDQAGVDQGEELVLPAVEVPAAAARPLRGPSVVRRAGDAPQRDPPPGRRRPRGHLDEPGRAVVGHPAAVRRDERRLRLVRRAHQLRRGRRLRLGPGALPGAVAGQPAHRRQGHHPLPLRHLAGDADEREGAVARTGVRPRLGVLQGRADEQVARQHRRSARRRQAFRPGSAAAVPGQGSALRRRRRLHLGALRGEVQRRPRQQPRQPREPRRVDDRALPPGPVERRGATRVGAAGHRRERRRGLPRGDGSARTARGDGGGVPPDQRYQRIRRRRVSRGRWPRIRRARPS